MKKKLKIISIVVASAVFAWIVFAVVDYNRALNGKKPIFIIEGINISGFDIAIASEDDLNNYYNKPTHQIKEYIGLGYKIIVCGNNCDKPAHFLPIGTDTKTFFDNTYPSEYAVDK